VEGGGDVDSAVRAAAFAFRRKELLDAAQIVGDRDPCGDPVVRNGLAMCKLHHAAFDRHLIGIRPDYTGAVRRDILDEEDGPMLIHGLKGVDGSRIRVPRGERERPDRSRLESRFEVFRRAE